MKKLLVGLAVVVLAVGGYLGVARYRQYSFITVISPHVKNTSLRLANASRYEVEGGTKITFRELFYKLESDIGEVDKRILEVQTIANPNKKEMTDAALAYMRESQELLRALLAKYRARLSASTASDLAHAAAQNANPSSLVGFPYKLDARGDALKSQEKALGEYMNSLSDVASTVKTLANSRVRVAAILPNDVLVDPTILEAIGKNNQQEPKGPPTPTP